MRGHVFGIRNGFLLAAGVTSLLFVTLYNIQTTQTIFQEYAVEQLDNQTCRVPTPDPWDPEIKQLLKKPDPLICKKLQDEMVEYSENGTLLITFRKYPIECRYRCFQRGIDDFHLEFKDWRDFQGGAAKPGCEFTEVQCRKKNFPYTTVYTNNFAWIKHVEKSGGRSDQKHDVVLFVVDSLSHSNAVRNLPATLKVLVQKYSSVVMDGFTKVGDNSFPNAAAFLTGKRVRVNGYPGELPDDMTGEAYDNWPIIWRNFSEKSYRTFYAEDYVDYNLFTYLAAGFQHQPTDAYFRPFWLNVYNSYLHRRSTPLCYDRKPMHQIQLNYLSQFLNSTFRPKFALNWLTELGHDFMHIVNVADTDFARFFEDNYALLKDSFIFVFGDHGHRFDAIRNTYTGRLEERLPFFSVHIPEKLSKKCPKLLETLRTNSKRLTTFYDLHATLEEILMLGNEIVCEGIKQKSQARGLSLLRPIPEARNCEEAGVPEEFCVCQSETPLPVHNEEVVEAAKVLVLYINELIAGDANCSEWVFAKVLHAERVFSRIRGGDGGGGSTMAERRLRVSISVRPSSAVFEALIRYHPLTQKYTIIGDVSRINKYGHTGDCINAVNLRKFCYCKV